jgi:hypothetical protein
MKLLLVISLLVLYFSSAFCRCVCGGEELDKTNGNGTSWGGKF